MRKKGHKIKKIINNMILSVILIILFCEISKYTNWYNVSATSLMFGMLINEIDNYFRD